MRSSSLSVNFTTFYFYLFIPFGKLISSTDTSLFLVAHIVPRTNSLWVKRKAWVWRKTRGKLMYATDRLFFSEHKMNGEASRLSRSAGHPNYSTIASCQTESTRKEKFSCAGILLCMASGMCFLAGWVLLILIIKTKTCVPENIKQGYQSMEF